MPYGDLLRGNLTEPFPPFLNSQNERRAQIQEKQGRSGKQVVLLDKGRNSDTIQATRSMTSPSATTGDDVEGNIEKDSG